MTGMADAQQPTAYERMGGDRAVRALVDAFYDRMDLEEPFADIRKLHPASLDGSRDKLYWYLSGWLGGPSLYTDRFGHPRLRARHLPFPIAEKERDQWLACMRMAMTDVALDERIAAALMEAMSGVADWMRNRG